MYNQIISIISDLYGWQNLHLTELKRGLINRTFIVEQNDKTYILQLVNNKIFINPELIDENCLLLNEFLKSNYPDYLFVAPVMAKNGKSLHYVDNNYYRAFEYVKNSHSKLIVENASQAFEAAKQFAQFTFLLRNFDTAKLKISLPHFHDLILRYNQFEESLSLGNKDRIAECDNLIEILQSQKSICKKYVDFVNSDLSKIRVTHHDTKISNVLFDGNDKGLCVIDLDTVMPGYFISDVGDMIRTYICEGSEEENDFSKITIRKDVLLAIKNGYLSFMKDDLSDFEKEHLFFAGEVMIFMQALRFITDYFNDDVYYKTTYKNQNKVRANNQIVLLQKLQEALLTL